MFRWIPYAMVRVTLVLCGGIVVGISFSHASQVHVIGWTTVALTGVYCLLAVMRITASNGTLTGFTGLSVIGLFGYLLVVAREPALNKKHVIHFDSSVTAYEVVLQTGPEMRDRSWRFTGRLLAAKTSSWRAATGEVLVYIRRETKDTVCQFSYGDHLVIKGAPQRTVPPANPFQFDFSKYLSYRDIHHIAFVTLEDIRATGSTEHNTIMYYTAKIRSAAVHIINRYLAQPQSRGIAWALILGVNDGLDEDLQRAYSASGATHVLSVSGLHVGVLYAMISFLLSPLTRWRRSIWLVTPLAICILWVYAFVTALSPSVLRAVTMFSFIALGKLFGRGASIYNTLASSAFVLLVFDPFMIMSVGFQLSYAAVLGIIYCYPRIYSRWTVKVRILDYIWQLTAVSIAAQLATFPLCLYYFHQFPVYFLLANLAVIPASFVVLISGVALLAFYWVPVAGDITAWILKWSIRLLNESVLFTERLPFSVADGIFITSKQCLLIVICLLCLVMLFEHRKFFWLLAAFCCAVCFAYLSAQHVKQDIAAKYLVVYHIPKHAAFEMIDNGTSRLAADSAVVADEEKFRFHMQPMRLFAGVSKTDARSAVNDPILRNHFFFFGGKNIFWLANPKMILPANFSADYIIVSHHSMSLENADIKCGILILDASNSAGYVRKLKNKIGKGVSIYSVLEKGAYLERL